MPAPKGTAAKIAGRKGALHRALGVPEGKPIGAARIRKATHSKNATTRREAINAETLKGFRHKKKKGA